MIQLPVSPPGGFRVILADPAWGFKVRSPKGEGRSPKYQTMTTDQLCAMPVRQVAARDSVLLMWVTDPFLANGDAHRVMRAWGFTPKTVGFYWIKQNRTKAGFSRGTGYWTRANPEICMLGTRGRIGREKDATGVDKLIVSPRREHSRKPDEVYDRIARLLGKPGPENPCLELFARVAWPGWQSWGNDVGLFQPPALVLP
jgi:N6-adenosine-specific RNA methylase IME4